MGKTVPSYRYVVEGELQRLKSLLVLPSEADKAAFEEVSDMCRTYASAGSNACSPILLEPIVVSILLGQRKRLDKLEIEIRELAYRNNTKIEDFR